MSKLQYVYYSLGFNEKIFFVGSSLILVTETFFIGMLPPCIFYHSQALKLYLKLNIF